MICFIQKVDLMYTLLTSTAVVRALLSWGSSLSRWHPSHFQWRLSTCWSLRSRMFLLLMRPALLAPASQTLDLIWARIVLHKGLYPTISSRNT